MDSSLILNCNLSRQAALLRALGHDECEQRARVAVFQSI
jgi:hypothetical protein